MVAQADLSNLTYLLPIFSFLIVFIVTYFAIHKSGLIPVKLIAGFISFLIAAIFVSALGPMNFVLSVIPWIAVLLVAMFFVMAMAGFLGKDAGMPAGYGKYFIWALAVIFIISGLFVFSPYYAPYLPGSNGDGANPEVYQLFNWLTSPKIGGTILLLGLSAIVGWFLVKDK